MSTGCPREAGQSVRQLSLVAAVHGGPARNARVSRSRRCCKDARKYVRKYVRKYIASSGTRELSF